MKENLKRALPDLAVVVGFLVIAALYFITPISENLVLGGHDTVAGLGQGHEQQLYTQETGEYTRWTGTMFSGMPTYQIAPSYGPTDFLGKVGYVLGLFTTGPLNYVFVYLLGFYLLMRTLRMRPAISALGASLWAFSSYFFIIIAAGHIWKVNTLGFIPPTIAGLVLAYRGKYLWGTLVTALFTALQVRANHIQMTYYFLFVMAFIVIAYGIEAFRQHRALKAATPTPISSEDTPAAPSSASVTPTSDVAPRTSDVAPRTSDVAPRTSDVAPRTSDVAPRTSRFGGFGDDFSTSPLRHFWRATLAIIIGGLLGALVNLPSLYHTYQYTHESQRGPSELTVKPAPAADASADADNPFATPAAEAQKGPAGLDYDYITAWSYGPDETLTLLIPMFKGGGSFQNVYDNSTLKGTDELEALDECNAQFAQMTGRASSGLFDHQYWGAQPMTVGPVYVGAIVCFLFILGLFIVRGPLKWALAAATLLSFIFAWGYHIGAITHFLIDYLPMYNKFRTVSSALVIAEFTMPLLAILALAEVLRRPQIITTEPRGRRAFIAALAVSAGLCLLFALFPGIAPVFSSQDESIFSQLREAGFPAEFISDYRTAAVDVRHLIVSSSAWRSFWLIVVGAAAIIFYVKRPKNFPAWAVVAIIGVISIGDMWLINRQYLNDDNFQHETERTEGFAKTPADEMILNADKTAGRLSTRVLNLTVNPFNESDNHTAYWHKSVGGYHAAKLHRYNDLIERYLNAETQQILPAFQTAGDIANDPHFQDSISTALEAEIAANPSLLPDTTTATYEALFTQRLEDAAFASVDFNAVCPVLNMLNTRWLILSPDFAFENPSAQGNAWILNSFSYVDTPDAEIDTLRSLDLRTQAIADKRFQQALGQPYDRTPKASAPSASASAAPSSASASADASAAPTTASAPAAPPSASATLPAVNGGGSVLLTSYAPNELRYTIDTPEESVVAFSEVYYPGWTATIDGTPAEVGRVNYILRALRVPAGKHEVIFTFKPTSIRVTNAIAYTAIAVLIMGFVAMVALTLRRRRS